MPNNITSQLEDGMVKTVFVPNGVADPKAPKVSELTGSDVLDLSYYLTSDGFSMDHSQESIEDDREGSAEAGQIPGRETFTNTTLKVIDNTNGDGENKAVETLTKGVTGAIVRRRGKPTDEAFKSGDVVTVLPVTIGVKTAIAHAANQRQLSQITFSVAPGAQDETAVVAAANGS